MSTTPLFYAKIYESLVHVARAHGYVLTLHGSMNRDLDLLAVPWIKKASPTAKFVKAIIEASGGYLPKNDFHERKPHGRMSWAIWLDEKRYIDLSVMPKDPPSLEPKF